jgi:squalene synthase HpnC
LEPAEVAGLVSSKPDLQPLTGFLLDMSTPSVLLSAPRPANSPLQSSQPGESSAAVVTLPETLRTALSAAASIEDAEAFTRRLAHSHYENFSVVSILLPRHLRQDFCNVYAFCRTADDLGDELNDEQLSLQLLDHLRQRTHRCYEGQIDTALFAALSKTIAKYSIPIQPFLDLIDAFARDQRVHRYQTFDQLRDYCRRSADPVGRLVLYMCGYRDEHRQRLSDCTCTALQLANFWQDVGRDLQKLDRIYLPLEDMRRFGVDEQQLRDGHVDENYRNLIRFQVDRTNRMFDEGAALLQTLDLSVRPQIALFGRGGRAILRAIRKRNYDTLSSRPSLSKARKARLIGKTLVLSMLWRLFPARRPA